MLEKQALTLHQEKLLWSKIIIEIKVTFKYRQFRNLLLYN